MATKKSTAITPKSSTSTALVNWSDELAKFADVAAASEVITGGGQFFGTKGGILTWQDAPLQNNQMAVIILDSVMENVFYGSKYDPDSPSGPQCFAFGRDEKTMAPHESVVEFGSSQTEQGGGCVGCPMNEFGSADTGRGKACRNTRRVAMIPAGNFDKSGNLNLIEDIDHFTSSDVGFLRLPVTSVQGYAAFVKQVAGALRRPPFGIVTKVKIVPDAKTQFRVIFEPITNVPDDIMPAVMARHNSVKETIDFPYQLEDAAPPPVAQKRGTRASAQPVAQKRGTRKY